MTGLAGEARRLLASEPLIAHLSTCRDDRPHVAPVWYDVVDDEAASREAGRRINRRYGADEDAWLENVLVRIDVGSTSVSRYE